MSQLGLQHSWPVGQLMEPQGGPALVVEQAQTLGVLFHCIPIVQVAVLVQVQIPPQSAPPIFGSQLSFGSSMQSPMPGHGRPAKPPQVGGFGSSTH